MNKYKWMIEGGMFFPISSDVQIYASPGPGVFNVVKHPNPMDGRIGLVKIAEKFDFEFKLYDLGCKSMREKIKATWNNEYFKSKKQNLGIVYNGTKGSGKTIEAKILANEMDMPVLIVSYYEKGILEFIQSLEFECTILIDEAEKTFSTDNQDADQTLLKIIDGVYNSSRKLYILTTNTLKLNENLIGRPGRIRYIKEFKNLPLEFIKEFLDENLLPEYQDKRCEIITAIESVEISTIDILKSIVDEVNIHGKINESSNLNIPMANKYFDIIYFKHEETEDDDVRLEGLKKLVKEKGDRLYTWSHEKFSAKEDPEYAEYESPTYYNNDYLDDKFTAGVYTMNSRSSKISIGTVTSYGEIYREEDGWVICKDRYDQSDVYIYVIKNRRSRNVYGSDTLASIL